MSSRKTVFLVEDNELLSDVISEMLVAHNFSVKTAFDGLTAIELYKQIFETVDVALLDLRLPDLTGTDLYLRLKQINPDIRAIFTSGYILSNELEKFMKSQTYCKFIQKPVQYYELGQAIKSMIGEQ